MTIAEILKKTIAFFDGNLHDIQHMLKVWGYAKTIGELEGLDPETQFILETTAIVHDTSCPCCRSKYGSAPGPLQEQEGPAVAKELLKDAGLTGKQLERVAFLVSKHHTYSNVDGLDWQILLEADYLVNAAEGSYSKDAISRFLEFYVNTPTGTALMRSIFRV